MKTCFIEDIRRRSGLRTVISGAMCLSMALANAALAHDLSGDTDHSHYNRSVRPPETLASNWILLAQANARTQATGSAVSAPKPTQAKPFELFAPRVKVRWDSSFLYIESGGLPTHNMMVGITAWQQQVPLPQPYFGDNAWRLPLAPIPAAQPQTIKNHFLRGAIAIAANGIPIFNPQNNRGEISAQIGELDQWGGHCGRADDYHYHAAPLHLQSVVGKLLPIAYALDGYAIFGLTEPDSSAPAMLDAFNGHSTAALGYHYHASTKYPYVNGGFHGEVTEAQQQVDPQPRAQPVRQDQPPLRGAKITSFTNSPDQKTFSLKYSVNGQPGGVNYSAAGDGTWKFQFHSADGTTREETYNSRSRRGASDGPPRERRTSAPPERQRRDGTRPPNETASTQPPHETVTSSPPLILTPKRSGLFKLTSPGLQNGGALPAEFTGDGAGVSLPLEWKGAPAGTKSFALIMDHLAPGNVMKCY